MGGSSTQTQHQTQSNTIDPMQMQQYQDNYNTAKTAASTLTPYTGQITAGFNPTQIQSQGLLTDLAADPKYQAANANATSGITGVLNGDPLATENLQKYMNPFQTDVIDASVAQNQYARDQQAVSDNAAATAANAFGGTRQAVQRAETTAAYDRNDQQNIASLNSANFTQAQQAALAAAGLTLNAAGQLVTANDASLNTATKQAGILASVGDAQQAQLQKELSDAYAAYTQGQNLTLAQQQLLNQALGIIPIQQTSTSDGTATTKSSPGIGGILGGIGSLALGIGSMGTSTLGGTLLGGVLGAAK